MDEPIQKRGKRVRPRGGAGSKSGLIHGRSEGENKGEKVLEWGSPTSSQSRSAEKGRVSSVRLSWNTMWRKKRKREGERRLFKVGVYGGSTRIKKLGPIPIPRSCR